MSTRAQTRHPHRPAHHRPVRGPTANADQRRKHAHRPETCLTTAVPPNTVSPSEASATHGQPRPENVKWQVPETNNSEGFKPRAVLRGTAESLATRRRRESPLCSVCTCGTRSLPGSHLVTSSVIRLSDRPSRNPSACVQVTSISLSNSPAVQERGWWQFRYAKEELSRVRIGFSTIRGSRHPLRALKCIPRG